MSPLSIGRTTRPRHPGRHTLALLRRLGFQETPSPLRYLLSAAHHGQTTEVIILGLPFLSLCNLTCPSSSAGDTLE
jgi:hypothetical protein